MSPFDPINQGLIIIALVGLMLILVSVITRMAPDLIGEPENNQPFLLRLPVIGWFLSLLGVGEVPLLFLLGIYPFFIGTVGWGGNLLWYWYFATYPTTDSQLLLIRLSGAFLARCVIIVAGKLKKILRTYTVADKMIPERFIGTKGTVFAVLSNGILEVNIYDEVGKCIVQLYCLPWESAFDQSFAVGDQVYIVDLTAPRRYSVVKLDSDDQLRALQINN
jgi:hypothetical protein